MREFETNIPLFGIIWAILIILKLFGAISLHWFWVLTSIIWLPFALFFTFMFAAIIITMLVGIWVQILDRSI